LDFQIVGFDLPRLLIMDNRFVHTSFLEQSVAKVVAGFRVIRFNLQGFLEMGDRFVHASLFGAERC